MSTPTATAIWLATTFVLTAASLVVVVVDIGSTPVLSLAALTALFATRVFGQLLVAARSPRWLPPMGEWNFMPYRLLLPAQIALLVVLTWIAGHEPSGAPVLGWTFVGLAFLYWAAMGLRYAIRMIRRPEARWLGGAIPIVFHCVLAAYVFVLGVAHIAA